MRQDPDVVVLQDFLRSRGFFDYSVSTGNYFTVTLQAVKKFQQTYNIFPLAGYFGSKSFAPNRINRDMCLRPENSVLVWHTAKIATGNRK